MSKQETLPISLVKELLNQQREDFSSMINSVMKSFNDRFDNLHAMVIEVKHSLEFSQKDLQIITEKCNAHQDLFSSLSKDIDQAQLSLGKLENQADYLENQSRRNNLHFSGIPEDAKESWDDTENKVAMIVKKQMGVTEKLAIERAHRIGNSKRDDKRPRGVVVKFTSYKSRELVLKNASKLKGTQIYVREDVSERVLARRNEQMGKLKEARSQGKIAYFTLDKLIIKERPAPSSASIVDEAQPEGGSKERPITRSTSGLSSGRT